MPELSEAVSDLAGKLVSARNELALHPSPYSMWYQEYYRFDVVLVVRVQHLGVITDPASADGE